MSEEMVTILDVAQAAGVSTQTVSRVLNDRPDVSAETRERVQQIIETLGYSPNVFARNLSRGRSNIIGVIGYGLSYFGPSRVLTGIEAKLYELGFSLTLNLIDLFDPLQVESILYDLLSRRVEGIIWAVPAIDQYFDWLAEKFSKMQTPVIYINKGPTDSDFVSAMDNKLGGRLATTHLMEQGYRRIGIITGPSRWWEAQERLAGWREVVTEAGYSNIDNLIVEGDWNPPSGDAGLQSLVDQDPEIDAVFISNDQMALGAMQASRHLGLRIPDDLGIVGFDDIPEAAYFYPPLTTIRQDPRALGAMAVEWINAIVKARQTGVDLEPDISWSQPRLVVRKSSLRESGMGE
ncbi:MAG: LacI family DNA-binding transcriptional regulator [Anaerolineales bacterium]|nr:LacI family DNA-binding transcriptional regulator [Anaerolineales bacterium]